MTSSTLTTWTHLRDQTIDRYNGQTPRPEDEGPIIDAYETHPAMVTRAIDEVAGQLAEGKITWAWSVLRSRVERGSTPVREATPNTGAEKQKRIRNAETWMRNCGLLYDEADCIDELFGERGTLKDYADDTALRQRMTELWQTERPRGLKAEVDALAWQTGCAAGVARANAPAATDDGDGAGADDDIPF